MVFKNHLPLLSLQSIVIFYIPFYYTIKQLKRLPLMINIKYSTQKSNYTNKKMRQEFQTQVKLTAWEPLYGKISILSSSTKQRKHVHQHFFFEEEHMFQ